MQEADMFLRPWLEQYLAWFYMDSYWWTVFGLIGQAIFGSRFILQWLASEREKKIVVPSLFWHLSFWGSCITLLYAFHVDKLPFILGNLVLPIIYGRNLFLMQDKEAPVV